MRPTARVVTQRRNRSQQLTAVPERRYAKLLEVFRREVRKDRLVYLVFIASSASHRTPEQVVATFTNGNRPPIDRPSAFAVTEGEANARNARYCRAGLLR